MEIAAPAGKEKVRKRRSEWSGGILAASNEEFVRAEESSKP
jgi:hypothetical protein